MRVKFECPITFIESEISRVFSVDNENPECIILNPGVDTFYGKEYFEQFKNLKVVGTPSTGVNHMDCEYLKKKEIKYILLIFITKAPFTLVFISKVPLALVFITKCLWH